MVAAVRQGQSLRVVARQFHICLRTVQVWVARAHGKRLDRVDWSDRPRGGRRPATATAAYVEDLIVGLRQQLQKSSPLGEYGAAAIWRELHKRPVKPMPSLRAIGRILRRRGVRDGQRRVRRPPPPKGWYLPQVADAQAELDCFDFVEGLVIRGGIDVMVLNTVSLHGCLCGSWVRSSWTAKTTVVTLISYWRKYGLPSYAQFDNDTIFQGAHQWTDSFGRGMRLCLQLGVMPVFTPPRETGFQATIENYNGRWQAKVWQRFQHDNLVTLAGHSGRFVAVVLERTAPRRDDAPVRVPFPTDWELDLQRTLQGTVVFLRRTNEQGEAPLLGQRYLVDPLWPHRLIRAEVDLSVGQIRFNRLRRCEPKQLPLIKSIAYKPPSKTLHE